MTRNLDSNALDASIHQSCRECGITANVLTCLKRYGHPPKQLAYSVSTYHKGKCDFCGEEKDVTEARDFFYPDYSLIPEVVTALHEHDWYLCPSGICTSDLHDSHCACGAHSMSSTV